MSHFEGFKIYKSAFEKMNGLMYILDDKGQLVDYNDNLLLFFGFDRRDNFSIYEMMQHQGSWTQQQIQDSKKMDLDILLTGKRQVETQSFINDDGATFFFEISRIPLLEPSGGIFGLLVIWEDVTKQTQLDEQLKEMRIELRYATKFLHATHPSDPEAQASKKTIKVLLIEDNVITQKIEKNILASCRCVTDVVATPEQVNQIFKPGKYDLVLMDIGLERGNGYQVTTALRQKEAGSRFRVPIIALTGYAESEVGLNCDDAEMDGIICKPLTQEQAQQLIQRFIWHTDVHVKGLKEFKQ